MNRNFKKGTNTGFTLIGKRYPCKSVREGPPVSRITRENIREDLCNNYRPNGITVLIMNVCNFTIRTTCLHQVVNIDINKLLLY